MTYRNGNYTAFYVQTPFKQNNLGANSTHDFVYYNLLKAWEENDSTFPFVDAHNKNYNVRDDSDWECTLKPRLRDRLRKSKNIILFLSTTTRNSKALREEIDYGINTLGLPVIVIYPEYSDIVRNNQICSHIKNLWNKLPKFKNSIHAVPTIHMPLKKDLIRRALKDKKFMVQYKTNADVYVYMQELEKLR